MIASRKQRIYEEILMWVLPMARNTQTWPLWRRWRINLYAPLELVHNIGPLMLYPEFRASDVYWLNTQANNFIHHCKADPRVQAPYETILRLFDELVTLLPAELEAKLQAPEIPRRPAPFSKLADRPAVQ